MTAEVTSAGPVHLLVPILRLGTQSVFLNSVSSTIWSTQPNPDRITTASPRGNGVSTTEASPNRVWERDVMKTLGHPPSCHYGATGSPPLQKKIRRRRVAFA